MVYSAAELPSDMGLQSLFGFDRGECLLASCLPRAQTGGGKPLEGLDGMRWTVTVRKGNQGRGGAVGCGGRRWMLRRDHFACRVLKALYRLPLVLRSIKH